MANPAPPPTSIAPNKFWPRLNEWPVATQAIWMALLTVAVFTLLAGVLALFSKSDNTSAGQFIATVIDAGTNGLKVLVGAFGGSLAHSRTSNSPRRVDTP